jgi:WD40 repeat protein
MGHPYVGSDETSSTHLQNELSSMTSQDKSNEKLQSHHRSNRDIMEEPSLANPPININTIKSDHPIENRESTKSLSLSHSSMDYSLTTLGGGALNCLPVIFSKHINYIFLTSGSNVRVYSLKTGELVHTLSGIHRTLLVACFLHPDNPLQLVTVDKEGVLIVWDYEDAVVLKVGGRH